MEFRYSTAYWRIQPALRTTVRGGCRIRRRDVRLSQRICKKPCVHSWLLAQARDVLAEICVLQVVRGGMCRKVARGKGGGDDANLAELEGGGKNSKRLGAAGSGGAKCASRTKNKKGKARKAKEDFGGSRRAAGRHLDSLYP